MFGFLLPRSIFLPSGLRPMGQIDDLNEGPRDLSRDYGILSLPQLISANNENQPLGPWEIVHSVR